MVSKTITKTNGKDKVIDFRDNLVVANTQDYANIHGVGGKAHAPNSTIRCTICDFTKGKGENSVTVSANIAVDVINRLYCVAEKQITNSEQENVLQITQESLNNFKQVYSALESAYKNGTEINVKLLSKLGQRMINGLKGISMTASGDFSYKQEKVDVYRKANGKAPVNKLIITRQRLRKDGQISNYPWDINIINGMARINEKEGVATTYNPPELSITGQAYINVNDADMYNMMYRIVSFIRIWENTVCIPMMQNGLQQREQERLAIANAKN